MRTARDIVRPGNPPVRIGLNAPLDIDTEFLRWQTAAARAFDGSGTRLRVNAGAGKL